MTEESSSDWSSVTSCSGNPVDGVHGRIMKHCSLFFGMLGNLRGLEHVGLHGMRYQTLEEFPDYTSPSVAITRDWQTEKRYPQSKYTPSPPTSRSRGVSSGCIWG